MLLTLQTARGFFGFVVKLPMETTEAASLRRRGLFQRLASPAIQACRLIEIDAGTFVRPACGSGARQHLSGFLGTSGGKGTTLSSQAGTSIGLAGLFVVLPTPHFLLEAASFDQLAEAADCLLYRFAFADTHDNH